jgi:hypothetical protein
VLVLTVLMIGAFPAGRAAAAETIDIPAIGIRIYDYAHMSPAVIARAQRIVDNVYSTIGVRPAWWPTLRADIGRQPAATGHAADLTVIILSRGMERRRTFREGVVGTAPISLTEGGQIAYLLADRILEVSAYSEHLATNVMGLVMAHEIAHLLLPYGSHSTSGVMRPRWGLEELRWLDGRPPPTFTPAHATALRHALLVRAR